MVIKSWESGEALEHLAASHRNGEMVKGIVRSVKSMKLPSIKAVEDVLIIALPGGVTGYCPASEFRERSFRNMEQFITQEESFLITHLDLNNQIAMLSAKKAGEQQREEFWNKIEELSQRKALDKHVFEGTVTGYNQTDGIVYVRVSGQDTYMYRSEWSWDERGIVDAQVGERVTVKVLLYDKEVGMVRVSRKKTIQDPWVKFSEAVQVGQQIAGRVSSVHHIHGIYVQIENGVEIKAGKVRQLEEPEVGDYVSCRLKQLDVKNRRGRVVITSYPRGKQKKKDFGSFLFE